MTMKRIINDVMTILILMAFNGNEILKQWRDQQWKYDDDSIIDEEKQWQWTMMTNDIVLMKVVMILLTWRVMTASNVNVLMMTKHQW